MQEVQFQLTLEEKIDLVFGSRHAPLRRVATCMRAADLGAVLLEKLEVPLSAVGQRPVPCPAGLGT